MLVVGDTAESVVRVMRVDMVNMGSMVGFVVEVRMCVEQSNR